MRTPPPDDVEHLLDAALERAPEDRNAFLDSACGDDEVLRAEVRLLLAAHEAMPAEFLAEPAVKPASGSDLELVAQTGHGWSLKNGELFSPESNFATLPPPGGFSGNNYRLRVKLRELTKKGNFYVILPVGDRMTGFDLDGFGGKYTGLNTVNDKLGKDVPGIVDGKQVKDSELHTLEVTMRLDGTNFTITTTLDARPLYEWTGPLRVVRQTPVWATTPPGSLAFGASYARWSVSEVKVKRLGPDGGK